MTADGPAGVATYTLLGKQYSIEVPDCGHMVPHITEDFDAELGKNVFVFHLHVTTALDDDRCTATDRQRAEIRGGKLSTIVAANGETVHYRWKFKLPAGFQTSPNFTHIFQIKSDAASPVMTLTPRNTTMAIDGVVGERGKAALAPFIDNWVVVELTVLYGVAGSIDMVIRRISDGQVLLSYSGAADTWQASDSGHDPKFGLYRSLNSPTYLRDEQVRFADFCVSKVSAAECAEGPAPPPPPPPDAGPAPKLDAASLAPDSAPLPKDTAPLPPDAPPPKLDAPVVSPPPPPPPPADAAASKLDAPVVNPLPVDAAAPTSKLDAVATSLPADAAAPRRDATAIAGPDLATPPPDPEPEDPRLDAGAMSGPYQPVVPGSSRTRRPGGGATGCAFGSGEGAPPRFAVGLVLALLLAARRRRS